MGRTRKTNVSEKRKHTTETPITTLLQPLKKAKTNESTQPGQDSSKRKDITDDKDKENLENLQQEIRSLVKKLDNPKLSIKERKKINKTLKEKRDKLFEQQGESLRSTAASNTSISEGGAPSQSVDQWCEDMKKLLQASKSLASVPVNNNDFVTFGYLPTIR